MLKKKPPDEKLRVPGNPGISAYNPNIGVLRNNAPKKMLVFLFGPPNVCVAKFQGVFPKTPFKNLTRGHYPEETLPKVPKGPFFEKFTPKTGEPLKA